MVDLQSNKSFVTVELCYNEDTEKLLSPYKRLKEITVGH